jgi:hypothetical protein
MPESDSVDALKLAGATDQQQFDVGADSGDTVDDDR